MFNVSLTDSEAKDYCKWCEKTGRTKTGKLLARIYFSLMRDMARSGQANNPESYDNPIEPDTQSFIEDPA